MESQAFLPPLRIADLDTEGRGVGRLEDGRVLFCPGTVPGDLIIPRIVKQQKSHALAEAKELAMASPDRVKAFCPYAARCGGCALQQYAYQAQLRWKQRMVAETLRRIGAVDCPVLPVLGMETPRACRAKSAFPFGEREGKPVLGLYECGSHRLQTVDRCPLQHPAADIVLRTVGDWARSQGISVYKETSGRGLLRHLVIRTGFGTGQVMVVLVTNGAEPPGIETLTEKLTASVSREEGFSFTSLWLNYNTRRDNVILGTTGKHYYGTETITERVGSLSYRLSPWSFFQVNPRQTECLYKQVLLACAPKPEQTVLDLYCGIGGIALTLAPYAKRCIGVESVPQAVTDAVRNAKEAGLEERTDFICSKAETWLPAYIEKGGKADIAVLDPPRKGCDPALLRVLQSHGPAKLVYVSCNPATLARDLALLGDTYHADYVQPVDMFPHTTHVECIVFLQRNQNC